MTKKTEQETTLPAVISNAGTFQIATVDDGRFQIDADLAAAIDDTDFAGFEDEGNAFPIVEIRQKELKNDKGKIEREAGNFRLFDPVTNGDGNEAPDVDGTKGLSLTFLLDQHARVFFPEVGGDPACRSADGKTGIGDPGGDCAQCKFNIIGRVGDDAKRCKAQSNILVYDHNLKACYVLRLGPSGLTPYKHFKSLLKRNGVPISSQVVSVTVDYKQEPAPHYVPVFRPLGMLNQVLGADGLKLFRELKELRTSASTGFEKSARIVTDDETDGSSRNNIPMSDPGMEVPPNVQEIKDNNDDGTLPF